MSCNGASSRDGAWGAAIALFIFRIVSRPKVPNATTPMAVSFFMSPPEGDLLSLRPLNKIHRVRRVSRLRLEYKNSGLIVVMGRCGNVIAIQLRRPEGGAGTCFRRHFPDAFVM